MNQILLSPTRNPAWLPAPLRGVTLLCRCDATSALVLLRIFYYSYIGSQGRGALYPLHTHTWQTCFRKCPTKALLHDLSWLLLPWQPCLKVNTLMFLFMKKCLITSVPSLLFFNFHFCSWYYHLVDIIHSKLRMYIVQENLNWRLIGGSWMGDFSLIFFILLKDWKMYEVASLGKEKFLTL